MGIKKKQDIKFIRCVPGCVSKVQTNVYDYFFLLITVFVFLCRVYKDREPSGEVEVQQEVVSRAHVQLPDRSHR